MTLWTRLSTFARRVHDDARGNVAMLFGLALPGLILMVLGGVDIHRASTVRINLQDALDAAALAAARSSYTTQEDIQRVGMASLRANLAAYPDVTLLTAGTTFTLTEGQTVVADARANVKTLVANIFLPPYGQFMDDYLPVGAHSEVTRSSKNVEVALVLDITGSMGGQKLTDMKAAATQLVDIVVQDLQTPWYSKMSLVPYSLGVNLGTYADGARGAPTQYVNVDDVQWGVGSRRNISSVNRSNGQFTSNGHGFQTGDIVWVWDASGMIQINDRRFRVVRVNNNRFRLQQPNGGSWQDIPTSSYNNYTGNGHVQRCYRTSDCRVQITTSSAHGLADGEGVYFTGVGGTTQLNNRGWWVDDVIDSRNYTLDVAGTDWGSYSSGGRSWCGRYGCQWRVYEDDTGSIDWKQATDCVSERTGAERYTDASPGSAKVGFNYQRNQSECPDSPIIPLTSSKSDLKGTIADFSAAGTTGGHIGTAWGWYTVAPNFNSLWPSSAAGAYNDPNVLKAVIIMTDGEYNVTYCSGVYSSDSPNANNTDQIGDCDAPNGNAFGQARSLCTAMKAQGVLVYTVGFQVPSNGAAANIMRDCATSASMAYLPASGADLTDAFKAIGADIYRLRISK
jgi:Flp pilus assembly protein TadG